MTAKECYEIIGGDYDGIISRLMTEERVVRFAGMFLKDDSYQKFVDAMEGKDYDEAFRMVHTLKGVVGNLSLGGLLKPVNEITEALRKENRDVEKALLYLPILTEQYERTVSGIRELVK